MPNKIKYGLKNVYYAKLTETIGVGGTPTYEYATPVRIPGAVSLSLDASSDTSPFYADDIVYFRTDSNNGYSGDLTLALIPEQFRQDILREEIDDKGVLSESSNIANTNPFALLFEFAGDEKAIRHVLYNCSASRPAMSGNTKEASIEPQTETLTLNADPRSDGMVKARTGSETDSTVYNNWFTSVYEIQNG